MFLPHDQTSVLLNAIAAKWEPPTVDKLDKTGSAVGGVSFRPMLTSGAILEPPYPPEEGR